MRLPCPPLRTPFSFLSQWKGVSWTTVQYLFHLHYYVIISEQLPCEFSVNWPATFCFLFATKDILMGEWGQLGWESLIEQESWSMWPDSTSHKKASVCSRNSRSPQKEKSLILPWIWTQSDLHRVSSGMALKGSEERSLHFSRRWAPGEFQAS